MMDPTEDALNRYVRAGMRGLRKPAAGSDSVFNDECMVSFDSPFSPGGLYVNLRTFQGFGKDFLGSDLAARDSGDVPALYVHIRKQRVPRVGGAGGEAGSKAGDSAAPTKMAIGVAGGFKTDEQKYETVTTPPCTLSSLRLGTPRPLRFPQRKSPSLCRAWQMPWPRSSRRLSRRRQRPGNKRSKSASTLPICRSTRASRRREKVVDIADPTVWACEDSGIKENLWLNLSDGYIGSGRRNWDGSGGTGAAKRHYEEVLAATGKSYPLVVKLGTITPDGKGDVYSYAKDEDDAVIDPHLPAHLARMGIDVSRLAKTEKSTAELAIELNLSYNFSEVTEEGAALVPVRAPNFVGLANLGNTCYINSTLQCLMALPEFRSHYGSASGSAFAGAGKSLGLAPQDDLRLQLGKLAYGLHTSRYVEMLQQRRQALLEREAEAAGGQVGGKESGGKAGDSNDDDAEVYVSPGSIRALVGKGHSVFAGPGQQDAEEFLQHLLDLFERSATRQYVDPEEDMSRLFRFSIEERLLTSPGGKVRYKTSPSKVLRLRIPKDKVDNAADVAAYEERESLRAAKLEGKDGQGGREASPKPSAGGQKRKREQDETKEKPVLPNVPFSALLEAFAAPSSFEFREGTAAQTTRFADFPAYLWVQMARYTVDKNTYQPVKLKHTVTPPLKLILSNLKGGGFQEGEVALEEDPEDANAGAAAASGPVPDASIVQAIVGMGFTENAGKRAALATDNAGAEAATNWLFGHMEDPDLNDPLPDGSGSAGGSAKGSADPAAVAQLCSMGMTPEQANFALQQPGNEDPNNAVMWFFSNQERLPRAHGSSCRGGGKGEQWRGRV